jgi:hypothetical protein
MVGLRLLNSDRFCGGKERTMDKAEVGDRILIPAEVTNIFWGGKFFTAKTRQGVELMLHVANADPASGDVHVNKALMDEPAEAAE